MNREEEIVARSLSYRKQYVEDTPGWYRGELHLGFTLAFTIGVVWYCAAQLQNTTWQEWLFFSSMVAGMIGFELWQRMGQRTRSAPTAPLVAATSRKT